MVYVLPRMTRIYRCYFRELFFPTPRRRRHRGAYHMCIRTLPGIHCRRIKQLTPRRARQRASRLRYARLVSQSNSCMRRGHSNGVRPNRTNSVAIRNEDASTIRCTLWWREKDLPFGLYYTMEDIDRLFDSNNPLSHFQTIRDFVELASPTPTDGIVFPHRHALIAAPHFDSDIPPHYGFYEASNGCPSCQSEELPIVLDTGASWSVTPSLDDNILG
jgi:hypothetical protein